ncbi:MAG: translation initiation factor IF-2 subunit alpha [Thermoprotei archaeon]|nr:MAG: translation initiation factor IF-2 subunit alpha [Thermoprotei archaeon]HDI75625.1 translation initiation factor IF-2 subunit alpha [Thermoprotei archaeon]
MIKKRRRLPRVNELVVATVKRIFEHGAFVTLDEYGGIEAYCPVGEASHTWFKSIRDVMREGQKKVFKVIRVNPRRGHVDVSLKRVTDQERLKKMREWKRAVFAHKLLEIIATRLGKTIDDAYRELGWKLEDYYGEIYAGFEELAKRGIVAAIEAGVSKEWAKEAFALAKERIKLPEAKISGIFTMRSLKPRGVEDIRKMLLLANDISKKYKNVKVRVYAIGAPRYRIDLVAPNYKIGEKCIKEIVDSIMELGKKLECSVQFTRIEAKR